jgi:hypothetical protein
MLPAAAMLAGAGCGDLCRLVNRLRFATASPMNEGPSRRKRHRSQPEKGAENPIVQLGPFTVPAALLVLVAVAWPVWPMRGFFFDWPPLLACRLVYSGNPFVECPKIANYLEEHTDAAETLAVLGSEPEVFFDAHRKSATGYIYTYGLMEAQPLAETMQKEMIDEIEKSKPRFIVVADVRFSWLYGPGSKFLIQDWANRYLRENYDVVGVVEQSSTEKPIEHWDESGVSVTPLFQPVRNTRGETRLGCVGNLGGYQPNVNSECVLWICRRKGTSKGE